jgi:outer membrane receptor protein involved in Fe transport
MKYILLFFISVFTLSSRAAEPLLISISGKVIDSLNNEPLDYALIALKDKQNEKILYSAFTGQDGTFEIKDVKSGNYWLQVTFLGYTTWSKNLSLSSNTTIDAIRLSNSGNQLAQVEVVAEKGLIKKEAGKTTYQVGKSNLNESGSLEDVVRNLPNVQVDQKGNVSIAGKKSVTIWLDGKPSTMAEVDVASFLKSIPTSSIESIEVITNPSARYDAEGIGGIIHVHLKKDKRDGLNGNVSAGYGFFNRANLASMVNYRKGKWNFLGNYGYRRGFSPHHYKEDRTIHTADSVYFYNMDNTGTDRSMTNTGKIGIDYLPNDNTTFSYTLNLNHNIDNGIGSTFGNNLNSNREQVLLLLTENGNRSRAFTVSNDISLQKILDTTSKEISASLTHTYVNNNNAARLFTTAFDGNQNLLPQLSLDRETPALSRINNLIFQFDYSQPTKWGSKLETGLKNETTLNENTYTVQDNKGNGYVKDTLLSNGFTYLENITAFYSMLSGPIKPWLQYSAGLRLEHTLIKSETGNVNRNYISFFPNVGLTFNTSETQSFGLTYSRRIQRPSFQQINNNVFYNDPYSTWQGNPFLRPAFEDVLSLNYSWMGKKIIISVDAQGSISKDRFSEGTILDPEGISRSGVYNGSPAYFANLSLYAKFDIAKWWTLQMNHGYNYQQYAQQAGLNNSRLIGHEYSLWLNSSFKFWKTASLEVGGWMNTGGVFAQGRGFPSGMLNVGLKKTFLNNKLIINISGQNLANTMNFRWTVENNPLFARGKWHVLSRHMFVSVTYNFGSGKKYKRNEKDNNDRLSGGGERG